MVPVPKGVIDDVTALVQFDATTIQEHSSQLAASPLNSGFHAREGDPECFCGFLLRHSVHFRHG